MKLHYLRIEGMGPFATPVSIDFSRFDASGIFLLEGPTGSGKSSIIDAITFALYGDVARLSDASKDRLRSSYCAPNDPSRVECIFEVTSGIYRVTRTPTYIKPGRKTKVNATIQLERVAEDDEGVFRSIETLSRSHAEADAEITSLVGLKKEQFLQTVVLPQGKFATFLAARSEARREILQDVFGTHIYQRLQERFREAAAEQAATVEATRSAMHEARAQIDELSAAYELAAPLTANHNPNAEAPVEETTATSAAEPAAQPESDEALISRLTDLLEAQHQQLRAEREQAQEALAAARLQEQHARQAALDLATRDGLVKRLAELDSQAESIEAVRRELTQARHAEAARPFIDDFDASYAALDNAYSTALTARQTLEDGTTANFPLPDTVRALSLTWVGEPGVTEQAGGTPLDPLPTLRAHAIDNEKIRARLSDLLPIEDSLDGREAELNVLAQRISDTNAACADADTLIAELPTRIEQAQTAFEEARRVAEGLGVLEESLHDLRQRLEHAHNAALYEARLPAAEQAVKDATLAAQTADAHARTLRSVWMADAASALARELNDDAPCPVCGSLTHPAPAKPHGEGEAVSHAQVEEADNARQAADRALNERREALADLKALAQREALSADGSSETLNGKVEAAQTGLRTAQEAADSLPALRASIEELTAQQADTLTRSAVLREEAAALTQQHASLAASIEADRRHCREAASPFDSLSAHDAALAARIDAVEQAIAALTAWSSVRLTFEASATRLGKALSCAVPTEAFILRLQGDALRTGEEASGPDTAVLESAAQAVEEAEQVIAVHRRQLRSAEHCSDLEATLETYQAALASTREGLKNPSFSSLTGAEDSTLQSCREQLQTAEEHHAQAIARQERAATQRATMERAIAKFRHATTAFDAAMQAAEPARRLHALASATTPENLTRTPLAAWVLMARFEEVLAAANPRLLAISHGRYELVRVDDDGSQSRKSGLGLAVIDHDTETMRLPSTLSGGETFYVSLSLALGLADVVTGENGGVELRTMFIDEGFGSLDAATLETVMSQLQRLRDSGRTVGVISHVHEMSTLIPDQIQVRWNAKEGSRVRIRA